MKTKVLIQVEGGNINFIASNQEIEIVIIDYDLPNYGEKPVKKIQPDIIMDEFYTLYSDNTNSESEIRDELKKLKL
jgi:hypothetical protein